MEATLTYDEGMPVRLCGNCLRFGSCLCPKGEVHGKAEHHKDLLECDDYVPMVEQIEAERKAGVEHFAQENL